MQFQSCQSSISIKRVHFLLLLVGSFFILSCKSHHYLTISSTNNEFSELQYKDSVSVSYRFNGPHSPIIVKIDNKSMRPVYVDWTKSSVVVNGESFPFYQNIGLLNSRTVSSSYDVSRSWFFRESMFTVSRTKGTIAFPESVSHIPDNSNIERYCGEFSSRALEYILNKKIREKQNLIFNDETTFLDARLYLTLSYNSDFKDSFIHTNNSYASGLELKGGKPAYGTLSENVGIVIQDKTREVVLAAVGVSTATLIFLAVINNFPK